METDMTNTLTKDPVVWTEIPVTNLEASAKFYAAILDAELTLMEMGPNKSMIFSHEENSVAGHLYEGKPAPKGTGSTVHFKSSVSPEEGMKKVEAAGGEVVSPVVEIPTGKFFYCTDLDGNSIGLFSLN